MKLAILTPGFKPVPAVRGGAIEQLIEYFIKGNETYHKYDIDLYTIDDPLLDGFQFKYTNLIRVPNKQKNIIYRVFYGIKRRVYKLVKNNSSVNYIDDKFAQMYKRNYYDAVLFENNMDQYKKIYTKLKNEKIYFHLHNDFDCGDAAKTREKTEFILKTTNKFLVVSKFLQQKLMKLGLSEDNYKLQVIYNGTISRNLNYVSTHEQSLLRQRWNIKANDKVFTFIGRFCSDKGIDKLIDAMNKLKNYDSIKCLIVGNNFFGSKQEDNYIKEIKSLAQGIKKKLIFTGYIDNSDINKIYSISDCVVIPSQYEEVFGVVALEAIEMGIPVIASESGGLQEVLSSECALYVKRNNDFVDNLSKNILKIASNKVLRDRMSKAGKKQSKKFPNSEIEYFKLLSKVLN